MRVGAILSQQFREKPKLHPEAFFSKKFSPAGQNYDIGNREFLTQILSLILGLIAYLSLKATLLQLHPSQPPLT